MGRLVMRALRQRAAIRTPIAAGRFSTVSVCVSMITFGYTAFRAARGYRNSIPVERADHHHGPRRPGAINFPCSLPWTRFAAREDNPAGDFHGDRERRKAERLWSRFFHCRIGGKYENDEKVAAGLLCLGVALLVGCQRHSTKEVFYLVTANTSLPYWQTAAAGFNHAAAQYGVTAKVVGPDGYDAEGELAELQKAVATKPAGILISVADAAVLQPGINAAIDAGVPVITIDSDAAASRRLYFIGTNNLEAGRMGGKRVIDEAGRQGQCGRLHVGRPAQHRRSAQGLQGRVRRRPDIKIVDVIDVKGDARNAFDKAQDAA